jgi:hypothetical protein
MVRRMSSCDDASKKKIVFIEENNSAMPLNIACLWWPCCHPTLQNPLSISLFGRLCFLSANNMNVVVNNNKVFFLQGSSSLV